MYANRLQSSQSLLFVQLFDILDKQQEFDEASIYIKLPKLNKIQLSNLKRHLYTQILTSLRSIHVKKNDDILIREQIDFAKILYTKGLYLQSLKLLDRIKQIAISSHQDLLQQEVIEFQKMIESRHITRSIKVKNKLENLLDESYQRSDIVQNAVKLSNLKLKLHGLYIQIGHIQNDQDRVMLAAFFKSHLKELKTDQLTFFERVHLYQCYVWYYYILADFTRCQEYATKWVQLFEEFEDMKRVDPDLYMRGLHYLLTSLYNENKYPEMTSVMTSFESFHREHSGKFDLNSHIVAFLYLNISRINRYFMDGNFEQGILLIPDIEKNLKKYRYYLDAHRNMVFYYKFAWLYFGTGQYTKALDYLDKIIYLKVGHLREDIQYYARLLSLITHYELGNTTLVEYMIPAVKRFSKKMNVLNPVQKEIILFFSQIIQKPAGERISQYKKFKTRMASYLQEPEIKPSFLYLDIISWLESKISGNSLQEVVQLKRSQLDR
jgi:hypothetical protein